MRGPRSLRGAAAAVDAIRSPGGIAQRIVLASVALPVVVVARFAILLLPILAARDAERHALHSQAVLIAAHRLEAGVLDLETGQRGFILTRQPQLLMPWQQAREELPRQQRALLAPVRTDPAQEARVRAIGRAARSYIDEQAGLRRVATLVAHGASPSDVLAALVRRTGRPARIRPDDPSLEAVAADGRAHPVRSSVAVPIKVEADLRGVVIAASAHGAPMPETTETRLGGFTELVSTAIANAEAKAALTASRARIVVTADETRRRLLRDLHDGAQRRFVNALLRLELTRATVPPALADLATGLDVAVDDLRDAIDSLRDFAHGMHPASVTRFGLGPALRQVADQSAVPIDLDVRLDGGLPESIEVAAYHIVGEALTNAVKHGLASSVTVRAEAAGDRFRLGIRDDGVGGPDFARGSGLVGLKDRVEALGGSTTLQSERAAGTSLEVEPPLTATVGASP